MAHMPPGLIFGFQMNEFLRHQRTQLVWIWRQFIATPIMAVLFFDLLFFAMHIWCMRGFVPNVLNILPATGGDTGSHLWPVVALREYGIPNLNLRVWNPANFAGEPLLVHYFPLPFVMMAVLSYFMPIGLAFNLISFAPVALLPLAIWWSTRQLSLSFGMSRIVARVAGTTAGIFSCGVLYNEGNTMWGGNFFSVLAGQFAHEWAFFFFFVLIGLLAKASSSLTSLVVSAMVFAAVVLSHAYVALFLPLVMIGALSFRTGELKHRSLRLLAIGSIGALLSVWFWWPLIDNSKWTTAYGFKWQFSDYVRELIPLQIAPQLVGGAIALVLMCFNFRLFRPVSRAVWFWGLQISFGVIGYFYFAKLGLVDVRTIPHVHFAVSIISAMMISMLAVRGHWILQVPLIAGLIALPFVQFKLFQPQVAQLNSWVNWNYSGWTRKEAASWLQALSQNIAGDFNDPRVAFEHGGDSNVAGTPRVFEMLPYFAGRSVMDGVYMQSTILAPMSFYHQATISAKPSCPFPNYECSSINFEQGLNLGRLLGVGTYLFQSDEVYAHAQKSDRLSFRLDAKYWRAFDLKESVSNVETIRVLPEAVSYQDWRKRYWNWFKSYDPSARYLITSPNHLPEQGELGAEVVDSDASCNPSVHADFNLIRLETNCPGKMHVLKYAFHDSWRASGDERLWLLSPGFIGIIPKAGLTELRFGQSWSWLFAGWLSILCSLGCVLSLGIRRLRSYYRAEVALSPNIQEIGGTQTVHEPVQHSA
jgi:hypothetical protein